MTSRKNDIFLIPDEVYPWDQLPEETDKAFAAFKIYMELRPDVNPKTPEYRSIINVARILKYKNPHALYQYSHTYRWRERINAIDEWELKILKTEEMREKIAMRKRHIALAQKVQKVGEAKLKDLLDQIENGQTPDIDINTLYKMIESAVKLEQLSAGLGDGENTTGKVPVTHIEIIMPDTKKKAGDHETKNKT